jgi:hypothetical protein
MTPLESTLISIARDYLEAVKRFYAKQTAGKALEDDLELFQESHTALTTLLQLGHMQASGMSEEGARALLAIEEEAAAAIPLLDEPVGYKATITIQIQGKTPDEFGQAMSNAFDAASFGGSGGNGMTANGTSYTCTVETNLPKEPMTLNKMLGMLDEHCGPEERAELRSIYGTEHLKGDKPA